MALTQISCDLSGALSTGAQAVPTDKPVVILLHGYKYAPGDGPSCPHDSLYAERSLHPALRSRHWPKRLNVGTSDMSAIGFGWPARGSVWAAWRAADVAGEALAGLVSDLKAAAPERDIHIVAHSMGARVAMTGLKLADRGVARRVILLNGADFARHAQEALEQQARSISLFNVTSRENAVFDALVELSLPTHWRDGRAIGRGISTSRAVTVRLDHRQHLSVLRKLGFPLATPNKRICHWSTYLRPGTGALYRALLDGSVRFATVKRALDPIARGPLASPLPRPGWAWYASTHPRLSVTGKT